jgi:hypothetical protein
MAPEEANERFKQCSMCQHTWESLQALVEDESLTLTGYQACFQNPDQGLILLTHEAEGCGTTLAIGTGRFKCLYHGPEYHEHATLTEPCPRLCIQEGNWEICPVECDMAWVRQVFQYLRSHRVPADEAE